ncbi:T9SS type A sorting domain-containing protein [Aequorivita sp. H23M31]|uniref:T9SS type A sorting domain-containing protein n=1 Tax=Aequorivita ciconiae TaxID=2494375 RepID=A0A410G0B8_9FLAO|nr:FG-GAP-like repeat-containing protein [Aequorivita sp. H23M31]QAA80715.1 T9SS type A sorting domain-containing protein [Aequorivita sp. H23M31]
MKTSLILIVLILTLASGNAQVSFTAVPISTSGSERAVVDMNGDMLDDLVSVSATNIQIFYQRPQGGFLERNITTEYADNLPSWSLSAGDYDNNGYNDLLYAGNNGVTFMRANDDGTAYEEDSFPQYVFSQRSNFVDINNDGLLDAFVCHDVAPSVYYINNGDGTFIFHQGDIGDYPTGGNYGSVWIDYDNDGYMDVFIAKCNVNGDVNQRSENQLYRNDGQGNFIEVGEETGLKDNMQTWSSAWADYDNDGYLDVFIGSSSSSFNHKLNRNNGDGTFTDISATTGIHALTMTGIENCTYDFNNDGYADIISNGNILLNNGDMTFTLIPNALPNNNGSFGDLNNDGFIDSFANGHIYYNNGNANHWIKIVTKGIESNSNGIGARITITSALGTQIREVRSGEGFKYMSTLNTHFGLGEDTEIATLTVRWPSGIIDTYENVDVDQTIYITEGSTTVGIEENVVNNLILYPNPTEGILTLSNANNFTNPRYSIFDMQGRLIIGSALNQNQIDVSQLANGTYLLKINDLNSTKIQRFIKK